MKIIRIRIHVISAWALSSLGLVLASCSSGPIVHEPATVPTAVSSTPTIREPIPATGLPARSASEEKAGEMMVEISSEPADARILINNQPMGRAPLRLAVKVTPQGFCADYITIRARFVAEDSAHVSQTVDEQFTPLEKPPATLHFTPDGGQRRMK